MPHVIGSNPIKSSFSTILPFSGAAAQAAVSSAGRAPRAATLRRLSPRELSYKLGAFILFGDWIAACLAISAGLEVRAWQREGRMPHFEPMMVVWALSGSLLFTWFMMMFKAYEAPNLYRLQKWTMSLVKSVLLCAAVSWSYIGLFKVTDYSPRIGVFYCMLALAGGVGLWRLCSFVFLVNPRIKQAVSSRIIVIGWNNKAADLRMAIRRDFAHLAEVVGCVPYPGGAFTAKPPTDVAVLGDFSSLLDIVEDCQASSIILADSSVPAANIQDLISFCQQEMLSFQMMPDYFPALNSGLQVQTISGVSLLGVSRLPLDLMRNRVLKRIVDIFGACFGIFVSSPVVLLFSILVYSESPGPVIYKQRRTSRNGSVFFIYKIRSMRLDAEKASGAVWCTQEDPRRLRIGSFMRRWNIDELPQFWNVLKGDMSLVGPRPERPELIEKFKSKIRNYNARHEVRSGLTGWAQIKGLRGDTDLSLRVEADLFYLENWSLVMDFYCIGATLFKTKNAM
jgi:exopolysaccharide biosynthesis polyprenyl glycosylphosphotransferase